MAKGFGVSPITNTIYYGTQDAVKHMWTGKKEDVTNGAIAAVYEWFMGNMDGNEEYSITFPSTEFELVDKREINVVRRVFHLIVNAISENTIYPIYLKFNNRIKYITK